MSILLYCVLVGTLCAFLYTLCPFWHTSCPLWQTLCTFCYTICTFKCTVCIFRILYVHFVELCVLLDTLFVLIGTFWYKYLCSPWHNLFTFRAVIRPRKRGLLSAFLTLVFTFLSVLQCIRYHKMNSRFFMRSKVCNPKIKQFEYFFLTLG